jgi:hypothetical protein
VNSFEHTPRSAALLRLRLILFVTQKEVISFEQNNTPPHRGVNGQLFSPRRRLRDANDEELNTGATKVEGRIDGVFAGRREDM